MASDSTDALAAALAAARDVLTKVGEAHMDDPTPCTSWNVRSLINHMVGAPRFAASRVTGRQAAVADVDYAAGDFVAYHDETARVALEAFGAPGAVDKTVTLPFGERPVGFLMLFVTTDQLAHAWDLARAVSQSTDIAPKLAAELLAEAWSAVSEEMRGADGEAAFGVERTAPEGASSADCLAAFLGRTV